MKYKRFYNNLFDSILLLIINISLIFDYILVLIFGIFSKKNDYFVISLVITSIVFSVLILLSLLLIIYGCFEKISFDDKKIYSKKPFRRTIIIEYNEILELHEEQIPAVILGLYKTNALIIKSKDKSICIYLDKNKTKEEIMKLIK